jgi:hypothetical protein
MGSCKYSNESYGTTKCINLLTSKLGNLASPEGLSNKELVNCISLQKILMKSIKTSSAAGQDTI